MAAESPSPTPQPEDAGIPRPVHPVSPVVGTPVAHSPAQRSTAQITEAAQSRRRIARLDAAYAVLLLGMGVAYLASPSLQQWLSAVPFHGLAAFAPWFGALGALTMSLHGVVSYGPETWETRLEYWHWVRPLSGAIVGIATFAALRVVTGSGTLSSATVEIVAFGLGMKEHDFLQFINNVLSSVLPTHQNDGKSPAPDHQAGTTAGDDPSAAA